MADGFLGSVGNLLGSIGTGVQAQAGVAATATAQGATNAYLGAMPGYGEFWTYDPSEGVEVTRQGMIVAGVAAVGLFFVLFR